MVPTDARAARRQARRALWRGGRVAFADTGEHDAAFWRQVPGGDRLHAVLALAVEWYGEEPSNAAAGLRGSPGGIRRR